MGSGDFNSMLDVMFPVIGTYTIQPSLWARFKGWVIGQPAQPETIVVRSAW